MRASKTKTAIRQDQIAVAALELMARHGPKALNLAGLARKVGEVKPAAIVAEVMGTGTLEARVKTTISPRLQERLAEVLVDQNDAVNAGQLLARLDDGELKKQVALIMAEAKKRDLANGQRTAVQ